MEGKVNLDPVKVYLGLGSNVGDRELNLAKALELLSERLRVEQTSPVYDTEPVGNINQPRFLNMVCQLYTTLPPASLLALIKGFELKMGRAPGVSNAPRTIDIDILFYGDQVINLPELVIPHPRLAARAFVLVPLADIAPHLEHPVKHKTVLELLENVQGTSGVVRWQGG